MWPEPRKKPGLGKPGFLIEKLSRGGSGTPFAQTLVEQRRNLDPRLSTRRIDYNIASSNSKAPGCATTAKGRCIVEQIRLFGTAEEAALYHDPGRYGYFSVLQAAGAGLKKIQDSYRLTDLPIVLDHLDRSRDSWISQAEFIRPNRRIVNLARIGLLFTDLDTYNVPELRDLTPEHLTELALRECVSVGLPEPSVIVFSGRGLQLKWLLQHPLPRPALPRWNRCQAEVVSRLRSIGSDMAARDASRVLRLVNTVNSKSREICRVTYIHADGAGLPAQYSFDSMADRVLPFTREQLAQLRIEREAEWAARQEIRRIERDSWGVSGLQRFSARQLAWHRLEDLRTLARIRFPGGIVNEGWRMKFLFWALNFLLLAGATCAAQIPHEGRALAREFSPTWTEYSDSELSTLYHKAKMMEAGQVVTFNGNEYPALYTPRNSTLIGFFQITDEEQRLLQTIISREEAARRHRARDEQRRRAAGAVERSVYLGAAVSKREQAQALRDRGLSVREIAAEMGISKSAAARYLNS